MLTFNKATFEKLLDAHSKTSFFGVFDGHRNSYASNFLQKNLHKCILNHSEFLEHPEIALKECILFLKTSSYFSSLSETG